MLDNVMQHGVKVIAYPIFNVALGVSPFLVSICITIPRLWDAFLDPIMGHVSDNARTRWGRRRPFIALGAVLSAIFFSVMWMFPRGWSPHAYFWWFLVTAMVFYTCYCIFTVPYNALGLELTPDYHERTRVLAVRTFFTAIFGFLNQWMLWLTQLPIFTDTVEGMRWIGGGIAICILVFGLIAATFTRERIRRATFATPAAPRRGFWSNVKESTESRPFRLVLLVQVLMLAGNASLGTLGFYVTVYHMFGGDLARGAMFQGIGGTAYNIAYLLSAPAIVWLSKRYGKRNALLACMAAQALGSLLKWPCYSAEHPWLIIIPMALYGPGFAAAWTITASMTADICDVDELKHGARREGLFSSVFLWCQKSAFSLSALGVGLVISATGFDAALGSAQSAGTITALRLIYAVVPFLAIAAAIWVIWKYPLTEASAHEVRRELEARRGVAA